MDPNYLDFEQPIAELQAKIDELRNVGSDNAINLDEEIHRLQAKMRQEIKSIFRNLTPWQISQLSRHPLRPYTLDYVEKIFDEFHELHGDAPMPTITPSWADWRDFAVAQWCLWGSRRGATPKPKSSATSECPGPKATARHCD
jgi:acetyl-CoA carboxylase alpha subunit